MPTKHTRYLAGREPSYEEAVRKAKQYIQNSRLNNDINPYLYLKPYDRTPGNLEYFRLMYYALNMLETMQLNGGRILEVGSGTGWLTEVLVALGFRVDAIEPSDDFIRMTRERIELTIRKHRLTDCDLDAQLTFHNTTLEDCELPENSFDGVVFYATLHHIVDEHRALAKSFRVLKPGGCLAVSCEDAWIPDHPDQMRIYDEEMAAFGTLESPFTVEYLDELLFEHGFVDVVRYHQVNGWFPLWMESHTIRQVAHVPARGSNSLIAYKPDGRGPTTMDTEVNTSARITVLEVDPVAAHAVRVKVQFLNTGATTWLHRRRPAGWVTIALYRQPEDGAEILESQTRHVLPRDVAPGESLELVLDYPLPHGGHADDGWYIDLINEGVFWFSTRGTRPARVIP